MSRPEPDQQAPDDLGFERHLVRSFDDMPVYAYSLGDESLPALALANAYGMPVAMWAPLARQLAGRVRLLTWETRGIPNLDLPFAPERCGHDEHARDLASVLDHFAVTRAWCVGWCAGAQVVVRFASSFPERVRAAVLLSGAYALPASEVAPTEFQRKLGVVLAACSRGPTFARTYSQLMCKGLDEPGQGASTGLLTSADPRLLPMTSAPFRSAEALYRYGCAGVQMAKAPAHAWAEEMRAPTLVMTGDDDPVTNPAASREMARRIPGAAFELVPGGDHFLPWNHAGLGERVLAFFDSIPSD
ncbi:alpha/beta fold hydrolase [Haliangium sp.]|uniref:alpha/beta fold hydrolase n=1 Tax=Haliangium sp. TaxID=2663208 RepID=UPI003D0CD52F